MGTGIEYPEERERVREGGGGGERDVMAHDSQYNYTYCVGFIIFLGIQCEVQEQVRRSH